MLIDLNNLSLDILNKIPVLLESNRVCTALSYK